MAVDYEKRDKIAIFTLNRPDVLNAINSELHRELSRAMVDFLDDPGLWVGIITGAGDRAFSAGMDLKANDLATSDPQQENTDTNILTWSRTIWKPLIAAINGYCLGAGMEIAALCDIRIAAEHARLGMPEVLRGLVPRSGGIQRLVRLIPRGYAAEVIFTGGQVPAQKANEMGLVNEVVPADKLMPRALEMAQQICQASPTAVRAAKEAMIRGLDTTFENGVALERELSV